MRLDGHVIEHAANLEDATGFVETGEYDLILLDIMLPDGDGRTFLKKHRASDLDTPVIILTARSQVSDRIGSLDLGADDYVTKPFDHAELEARCRAVLRRKAGKSQTVIDTGGIVFDPVAGHMAVRGQTVTCVCWSFCSMRRDECFQSKSWPTGCFHTMTMPRKMRLRST